jgi:hypothetical protein
MARPLKWSRDLHRIRERATHARTETWSRTDLERLFEVSRATAQSLMKAVGEVQTVGAAHFVDRASLLSFLEDMIAAPVMEERFRMRLQEADAPSTPRTLRVSLPADLRQVTLRDLPLNISLTPGRLEITADTAVAMLESLALLATAMQNDLASVQVILEPPKVPPRVEDDDLQSFLANLRSQRS